MESEEREALLKKFEKVLEFRDSLSEETDRGCALMAASYLEQELEQLLRARLVDDQKIVDELFRPDGPLGTFSARIDMAYVLGLIGSKAQRDLHLIRRIRNDFGHDPFPLKFTDPSMRDRCLELYHGFVEAKANPRGRFTNVVMGVLAVIHVRTVLARHFSRASDPEVDEKSMRESAAKWVESIMKAISDKES
jgi:DNA-binding MltR family transcriptional regulator